MKKLVFLRLDFADDLSMQATQLQSAIDEEDEDEDEQERLALEAEAVRAVEGRRRKEQEAQQQEGPTAGGQALYQRRGKDIKGQESVV